MLNEDGVDNFRVLVRIRPLENSTVVLTSNPSYRNINFEVSESLRVEGNSVVIISEKKELHSTYDGVVGPYIEQNEMYESVSGCTEAVLQGIHATILAYGQTGSGKTYSMFGGPSSARTLLGDEFLDPHAGIIPRAMKDIFRKSQSQTNIDLKVTCSFVQVYNENLYDMLRDANLSRPLSIRELANGEVYVQGLSEYSVKGVKEAMSLLSLAEENPHSGPAPSGSGWGEVQLRSKYCLVDLAGSEKWNTSNGSSSMETQHISELTNINLSLHTLGRCISFLAKRSTSNPLKDTHIPFRDSKLTRLLQDGINGSAKVCLLATVSASPEHYDETRATLAFVARARQVRVSAVVNATRPVDHALVTRLQKEVIALKEVIRQLNSSHAPPFPLDVVLSTPRMQIKSEDIPSSSVEPVEPANLTCSPIASTPESVTSHKVIALEYLLEEEKSKSSSLVEENLRLQKLLDDEQANNSHRKQPSPVNSALRVGLHSALSPTGSTPKDLVNAFDVEQREVERAMTEMSAALARVETLWSFKTAVERTLKKFFRYEIEEEEMQKRYDLDARDVLSMHESPAPLLETVSEFLQRLQKLNQKSAQPGEGYTSQLSHVLHELPDLKQSGPVCPSLSLKSISHDLPITSVSKLEKIRGTLALSPTRRVKSSNDQLKASLVLSPIHTRSATKSRLISPIPDLISKNTRDRNSSSTSSESLQHSIRAWREPTGDAGENDAKDEATMQEALILRKIQATEKRLEKNRKLQEWLLNKEEKSRGDMLAQSMERSRIREEVQQRESKRQEHVRQQKLKLEEYHSRVKQESQQIQSMLSLGIDPSSLYPPQRKSP